MPDLLYLPPTTFLDPKQRYIKMGSMDTLKEADEFKRQAVKDNRELRKGSWFLGNVRI